MRKNYPLRIDAEVLDAVRRWADDDESVEMMALADKALAKKLEEKRKKMAEEVEAKGRAIEAKE